MENLDTLNKHQYQAVTSQSKYLRIIAGAGSGKTRVLTFRIAYLIEQMGLFPSQILAITFTNKAAEEIKYRVQKMLNNFNMNLKIATFHSFCARILREDIRILNYPSNFTILDEDDQKRIIKKIIEDLEINDKNLTIKNCINFIEMKKNNWESCEDVLKHCSNNSY